MPTHLNNPPAPSFVQNLTMSLVLPRQFKVRWDVPESPGDSPITGYSVEIWEGTEYPIAGGAITTIPANRLALTSMYKPKGSTWSAKVWATNSQGNSIFMACGPVTIPL